MYSQRAWPIAAYYSNTLSVGIIPDLGYTTSAGGGSPLELLPDKEQVISRLKKAAKECEIVYLSPDPDREGEAIAWHIAEELKSEKKKIKRILFNEITKKAVSEAINHPLEINKNKFKTTKNDCQKLKPK